MELLNRGNSISFQTDAVDFPISSICIGLNWGAILKKRMLFGLFPIWENVDLDLSALIFNKEGQLIELIYPHQIVSNDSLITHSGDDPKGDRSLFDDHNDNEWINIKIDKLSLDVVQIFFVISHNTPPVLDFGKIPYTKIRLYSGSPNKIDHLFAVFSLHALSEFDGKNNLVAGKLIRDGGTKWRFVGIGEAVNASKISEMVNIIEARFIR